MTGMAEIGTELQSAWLGAMQQELGVNASNLMLKDLVIAALEARVAAQEAAISSLTDKLRAAEMGREELRQRLAQHERTSTKAAPKPRVRRG